MRAPSPTNRKEERQNRRASGTSAGEEAGGDGCRHPATPGFSPATGDPIACRSAVKKRKRPSVSVTASWRGRRGGGLAFFARAGGRAAWRFQRRHKTV
jgi:hypothetical protein